MAIYTAVPGVYGFGTDTRGAYGGAVDPVILHVDTLSGSSISTGTHSGSFSWCVSREYPRVIVFDVSGVINTTSDITISQTGKDYCWIAGQTAPSPGIMIYGQGMRIYTHDLVMQHIAVRVKEHLAGKPGSSLNIKGDNHGSTDTHNLVFDHCSFAWARDENITIWGSGTDIWDITLANCIIAEGVTGTEPYHDGGVTSGTGHSCGSIISRHQGMSIMGNLYISNRNRNPYIKDGSEHIYHNNIFYNYDFDSGAWEGGNDYGRTRFNFEGNHTIEGPSSNANMTLLRIKSDMSDNNDAQAWFHDNISIDGSVYDATGSNPDNWDIDDDAYGGDTSRWAATARCVTLPPSCLPYASALTYDTVLANAGTRPADRDSTDTRLVAEVVALTGSIKDTTPSFTAYAENTSVFVPVDNPHDISPTDPNGIYTNLEVQLHELAAEIEGSGYTPPTENDDPVIAIIYYSVADVGFKYITSFTSQTEHQIAESFSHLCTLTQVPIAADITYLDSNKDDLGKMWYGETVSELSFDKTHMVDMFFGTEGQRGAEKVYNAKDGTYVSINGFADDNDTDGNRQTFENRNIGPSNLHFVQDVTTGEVKSVAADTTIVVDVGGKYLETNYTPDIDPYTITWRGTGAFYGKQLSAGAVVDANSQTTVTSLGDGEFRVVWDTPTLTSSSALRLPIIQSDIGSSTVTFNAVINSGGFTVGKYYNGAAYVDLPSGNFTISEGVNTITVGAISAGNYVYLSPEGGSIDSPDITFSRLFIKEPTVQTERTEERETTYDTTEGNSYSIDGALQAIVPTLPSDSETIKLNTTAPIGYPDDNVTVVYEDFKIITD